MVNSMIADHHKSSPDTKMAEGLSLDGFRERLKPYELAHSNNLMKDDYRVMLLDHLSISCSVKLGLNTGAADLPHQTLVAYTGCH